MGGMNGFTSFNPGEVLEEKIKTELSLSADSYFEEGGERPIFITKLFGEKVKITIPSHNRNCSFLMNMNDFKNPDNHQYSYQLQPKETFFNTQNSPWISNGKNRKIQFDYLPAGDYNLNIRGVSSAGIVTDIYTIELEVKEFFYRTWWFILFCSMGISGLFYAFYKNRLANAIKMERLRTRLSSDLHDDVGSLLSGVAYQMELLEYSVSDKNKSLVQQIASSSRKAMSQMRDVVWAIDSRSNTFQDLTERMRESAEEILGPLDIQFRACLKF